MSEPVAGVDAAGGLRGLRRRHRVAARARNQPAGTFVIAFSLFATTVVTSGFGFAFWVVAARTYTPAAVGAASAAISAMQFLATFSMLGFGTLLIAELSGRKRAPGPLITTAVLVALTLGATGALLFGAIGPAVVEQAADGVASLAGLAMFVATTALTAVLLVLDDAVVGLSRPGWQVWRNLLFAVGKLAALPIPLLIWAAADARGVLAAWLLGAWASAVLLVILIRRGGEPVLGRPRLALLRELRRTALTHHWLNVAQGAPRLLLPVLVAGYLSAAVNASFYTAVLLVQFAHIVPGHLATALFAVSSRDRRSLRDELRRAMRVFLGAAAASAIVFAVGSSALLSVFGPGYDRAAGALAVLGLATVPTGIKAFYMAACRVNGDLGRAAVVCVLGSVFEVAVGWAVLALGGGLLDVAVAWVLAMSLQALVMWPAVAVAGALPGRVGPTVSRLLRWSAPRTLSATDPA